MTEEEVKQFIQITLKLIDRNFTTVRFIINDSQVVVVNIAVGGEIEDGET